MDRVMLLNKSKRAREDVRKRYFPMAGNKRVVAVRRHSAAIAEFLLAFRELKRLINAFPSSPFVASYATLDAISEWYDFAKYARLKLINRGIISKKLLPCFRPLIDLISARKTRSS